MPDMAVALFCFKLYSLDETFLYRKRYRPNGPGGTDSYIRDKTASFFVLQSQIHYVSQIVSLQSYFYMNVSMFNIVLNIRS